ncbi:conserved membrane hypothetical protein [uncultured Defluviicoccus sp.]|uniref:DUF4239 domain-containing protein n=1 Tax=metagenome TaxID=256318 RepID=A0A380T7F6_9ZZZZ|nr:conserved membrane hypothetical protein [uncultured Defluviicoccus sp.]
MLEVGNVFLCLGLLAGMLILLEVGYRFGARRMQKVVGEGTGLFDSAIFALLGLLLGFAFAGAVDRLNDRRDLIVEEANAISTAYLLVDMLASEDQNPVRENFHAYLAARLEVYREIDSGRDPSAKMQETGRLQNVIWDLSTISVKKESDSHAAEVYLPALTSMIDVTTKRKVALDTHIPGLVLFLLICVSLCSALVAGAATSKNRDRQPIHAALFAGAVALTVYTILDLDNPRGGLIRLDAADRVLTSLRDAV